MDKDVIKSLIQLKQRELPLNLIQRDNPLPVDSQKIIVVPGVRRCGKSMKMNLVANHLVNSGMDPRKILWIGFDDERFTGTDGDQLDKVIQAYRELYPDIPIREVYMFFDEIQLIENWHLFIIRLYKNYCRNIFISGSNATLLSKHLKTELRGWPIEFETYPLSFREFCRFKEIDTTSFLEEDLAKLRNASFQYNHEGGFPEVVLNPLPTMKNRILQSYFDTMILKDLCEHYAIDSTNAVKFFAKRIMANVSKPTSVNSIYNDFKSQGFKISKDTLYHWAEYVCEIFLFQKIKKYSSSLAQQESSLPKYYCIDNGLRTHILLPHSNDDGKNLENNVFLHLWSSRDPGDEIFYFKEKYECDFIKVRQGNPISLIQVCWNLSDLDTKERELRGLSEAMKSTGCKDLTIVTQQEESQIDLEGNTVNIIPAWKYFLNK